MTCPLVLNSHFKLVLYTPICCGLGRGVALAGWVAAVEVGTGLARAADGGGATVDGVEAGVRPGVGDTEDAGLRRARAGDVAAPLAQAASRIMPMPKLPAKSLAPCRMHHHLLRLLVRQSRCRTG